MEELGNYKYRGARALVLLHEKHMRECLGVWKRAKAASITLPDSDERYASLDTLLVHILRAARSYMVWMCKQLELPNPEIQLPPEHADVQAEVDSYLEHVFECWRAPLANVPEEEFGPHGYVTGWGETLSIEAMLEHAVMHPIRHQFQLKSLMAQQAER